MKKKKFLTSEKVIEQSGVTYRMLDYWVANGVVPTIGEPKPGSGNRRHFDPSVVPRIKLLHQASLAFDYALTVKTLKKIYDNFEEGKLKMNHQIWIVWT